MTRGEFDRWLERYCILFPETTEWMGRVEERNGGSIRVMLDAWFSCLVSIDYRDILAATELMFSGDDPNYQPLGVHFGDREKTPAHVKRLAWRVRNEREARESKRRAEREQHERRRAAGQRCKYSMGELYRAYVDMLEAGDPEAKRKMHAMADQLPDVGDRGHGVADGYRDLFSASKP